MVRLLVVAGALGLSNLAAAVAIGLSGVDRRLRLRVALVFGVFEAGMPMIGILLGRAITGLLGGTTALVGGGLLVATGAHGLWNARRGSVEAPAVGRRWVALLVTGVALSIDNLVSGLALGIRRVPLVTAAVLIGAVSVVMSLVGLEMGSRLGLVAGPRGEVLGAAVLVIVGVAVATRLI